MTTAEMRDVEKLTHKIATMLDDGDLMSSIMALTMCLGYGMMQLNENEREGARRVIATTIDMMLEGYDDSRKNGSKVQ
jgi:hypothetical protein